MKPEVYAKELQKSLGLPYALKVSEQCMRNTQQSTWSAIPRSIVYYTKDKRGNEDLNRKELTRVHGWWSCVYHTLRKKTK